jgi:phage baseplate assembly protein gpV
MINEFLAMNADLQALKNAFGRMGKVGVVHAVDASKGYRLRYDDKVTHGAPFLSPWLPHPETGKTSVPLKVGEVVGVFNPGGDLRQGFIVRGGYTDAHPSPNDDVEANVFADAGVRVSIKDGVLHIKADNHVVVEAASVSLGGEGGKKVARVGDKVNVGSGSSKGLWPIVEGSTKVTAVD